MSSQTQEPLARTEVVLRQPKANDDVRVHNKRLRIDEVIQIDNGLWRVIGEELPTRVGVVARYICCPLVSGL